jgi:hypothetical protein
MVCRVIRKLRYREKAKHQGLHIQRVLGAGTKRHWEKKREYRFRRKQE